jgi:hypothetical protein
MTYVEGPLLADSLLCMAADSLNDIEQVRMANASRLRILTTPAEKVDSDGVCRGHGLTEEHPLVAYLSMTIAEIEQLEKQAVVELCRAIRSHPLYFWVQENVGIGEKQAARLLAVIRDPWWHDIENRPRQVSELWAYCGLHVLRPGAHGRHDTQWSTGPGVAPRRKKGVQSTWSEAARMRLWLISTSCVKHKHSPYRLVYDRARKKYADAIHLAPCVRCGPSGSPAPVGTPLSRGHQHARALRIVSKEILRDLWIASRALHGAPDSCTGGPCGT